MHGSENAEARHTTAKAPDPFDLDDAGAYRRWREWKMADYPLRAGDLVVPIQDARRLSEPEHGSILGHCRKANLAIYDIQNGDVSDRELVRLLGRQFGLLRLDNNLRADEDSITAVRVVRSGGSRTYIPYSNQRLNWHTDGYYNPGPQQVRAIIMHCVSDAREGGENRFLDHEIAYILLRDHDPRFVAALMQSDVMTIPANEESGTRIRGEQTGPVFSVDRDTGTLHMRYTARGRNIIWKDDPMVRQAREFLTWLLGSDSPYILPYRLRPGQGVISNNVLHYRGAFTDEVATGRTRLLLRARYHERIEGTALVDQCTGLSGCCG